MATTEEKVPNTTMGAAFEAAGVKPESPVRLVVKNGAHIADPLTAQAPVQRRPCKSPTQRFNRCVQILYGSTSDKITKAQAKMSLIGILNLVREGELSEQQLQKAAGIVKDAREYGDFDCEVQKAFCDLVFDCYRFVFS